MPTNNKDATAGIGILLQNRSIDVITTEIHFYKNQAGAAILEIGHRLIEAKEQLQHGEWLDWLRDSVDFSEITAQRFMRIAREYANPSLVTDLGIAKAVTLLALPASERDEFIAEPHDVDGENKAVSEMSRRELEQAVREKKEALEAKAAADRLAEEHRQKMQDAIKKVDAAKAEADRAQAEKTELERQMEELRNAATGPDEHALEDARQEAAAIARKEAQDKLLEKISAVDAAKIQAETERDKAEAELERIKHEMAEKIEHLENQLTDTGTGSQTLVVFKTHFEGVQISLNKMLDCIQEAEDESIRDKLTAALSALCSKVLEQLTPEGG